MGNLDWASIPLELVVNILNVIILFLILRFLVYRPVKNFMDQRTERIQAQMDEAEKAKQDAIALKDQYDQTLHTAKDQTEQMLLDAEKHAQQRAQQIVEQAQQEAANIVSGAKEQAAKEHERMLDGIKDEVASLSIDIAKKILVREVNEADNQAIVDRFFHKVG